jgi:hypothetical protein
VEQAIGLSLKYRIRRKTNTRLMLQSSYLRNYNLSGRKCICEEEEEVRDAVPLEKEDQQQATGEAQHLPERDKGVREVTGVSQSLHELAQAPDVLCNNTRDGEGPLSAEHCAARVTFCRSK